MLIQPVKVISLDQLIGKLCKADPSLAINSFAHTFLAHHIINSNVFSHIPDKVEKAKVLKPIVIIDHFSGSWFVGVKIQEFSQLFFYAFQVVLQHFLTQKISFLAFATWVAYHTGSSTNQNNWFMTSLL